MSLMDLPIEYRDHGLDEQEQQLLYNVEVMRTSVKRAGEIAGVRNPYEVMQRPHVLVAREKLREALRGRVNITRDDVIAGIREAIDQAVILADPVAQISGWREIAKILGYDKTPNVNVHIQGTLEQVQKQFQNMPVDQLMKEAGMAGVIDGDFYKVEKQDEAGSNLPEL